MTSRPYFSPAEKTGLLAIILAAFFLTVAPPLAILPLAAFVLLCLSAPFFPASSFFLPVISRGARGVTAVALTFDDGPSPDSTPALLRLLDEYQLKATFFVIGEKAAAHPELIREILEKGHTLGNHSYRHDSLLMLRGHEQLKKDIQATQDVLEKSGVTPLVFRPPVGITNPRLKGVLRELGLTAVNFSCRIFDRGNSGVSALAARVLARLRPGDIIVLHDLRPDKDDLFQYRLEELARLFGALRKEYTVLPLQEVIKLPVARLGGKK